MARSTSAAKKPSRDSVQPRIEERLALLRVALFEGDEQEQRETFAFLKEARSGPARE